MGDHFVLLVDRLLTESTLEAAIESRLKHVVPITVEEVAIDYSYQKDSEASLSPRKVVECRICQDEGFDSSMEAPCSCSGSLKYAHRRCVQKWCNEKGDTMCEICHQQFKPGYTAPPPIFRFGGLPMNLRGNWQIARRDLNNPRIIAMVAADHSLLDPEYDEYAASTSRSIVCCRTLALIFMVLLIIRHTLPVVVSRAGNYSLSLIMLLLLRVAGIIIPICIILKAVTSIIRHRQQQTTPAPDEESSPLPLNEQDLNAVS
ncbi:uncharacterized protein LOC121754108 [Salvia splendens]|uniref:uncharacterized protein LOC121754108 n=1 Tax=Salvia splendens TaxID=180675 RepID=UPI001C251B2D|nr:uncharacterized protein LOC121754108 [Salvia splendens]XP_042005386.1 uncharacterized protein LOC121754108 [Salvia splendens]